MIDAIVTAGGRRKPDDPLYELTGVEKKALIPLLDKPMIQWVIEALFHSGAIGQIVIVGLRPDELDPGEIPVHFVDAVGGMIDNILVARDKIKELNPDTKKILVSSSDIPLITPEIVSGFIKECGSLEADLYYAIVEEKTMEARFPHSKRTFFPLKGGRYSGGDLVLADITAPDKADLELLRELNKSRKNYWKQARMLGLGFILKFLFRMMTIDGLAAEGGRIFNLEARAVVTRFAELGMDVDKVNQYELIKTELEKQGSTL